MKLEHVEGKIKSKMILYALSTCIWCKKTKQLLNDLGADYYYIFVDELDDDDKEEAKKEITKWNPDCSFPTIVIDNKSCILGFRPDEIKKGLKQN